MIPREHRGRLADGSDRWRISALLVKHRAHNIGKILIPREHRGRLADGDEPAWVGRVRQYPIKKVLDLVVGVSLLDACNLSGLVEYVHGFLCHLLVQLGPGLLDVEKVGRLCLLVIHLHLLGVLLQLQGLGGVLLLRELPAAHDLDLAVLVHDHRDARIIRMEPDLLL